MACGTGRRGANAQPGWLVSCPDKLPIMGRAEGFREAARNIGRAVAERALIGPNDPDLQERLVLRPEATLRLLDFLCWPELIHLVEGYRVARRPWFRRGLVAFWAAAGLWNLILLAALLRFGFDVTRDDPPTTAVTTIVMVAVLPMLMSAIATARVAADIRASVRDRAMGELTRLALDAATERIEHWRYGHWRYGAGFARVTSAELGRRTAGSAPRRTSYH